MILPWEQEEIKRVIEMFGCKVVSLENVKEEDQHVLQGASSDGGPVHQS